MNIDNERKRLEDVIVRLQIDFNKGLLTDAYVMAMEIRSKDKELGYKYMAILNRYWGER